MSCPKRLGKWLDPAKRIATREAAGVTVVQLAAQLGTSPSRVRHWERGAHPLADMFLDYCELLERLEKRK